MSPPIRALALETTSRRAQIALVENGVVIAEAAFESGFKHTAHLLPLIDRLCCERGWSPAQLEEVYVSAGPGGFTGTRVGITFAKTFAMARAARIVAVCTARVLVGNAPTEAGDALVVIDARRGKAWTQRFARHQGDWDPIGEPTVTTLAEALALTPRPIWLVGEGVAYHAGGIDVADAGIHICAVIQPRVSIVAAVGWAVARQGLFNDPFALVPIYVRRPEAEEKRLGMQ